MSPLIVYIGGLIFLTVSKTNKFNRTIDLHSSKSVQKWVVLGVSLVIGVGSIVYSNRLVNEIKKRERRQIALYSKALEYIANENDGRNVIFTLEEIIQANTTIPVILTNQDGEPIYYRNIPSADAIDDQGDRKNYLINRIGRMKDNKAPIMVELKDPQGEVYGTTFIYYEDSNLLIQLRYYPYVQLSIILVFVLIVFSVFNYSRLSEQNRVWVGLAKETAHQLGTPLSSLMAWIGYLKDQYKEDHNISELDKDVHRLEVITQRFSSIGSVPNMEQLKVYDEVKESVDYLRTRISKKVEFNLEAEGTEQLEAMMNRELFSWVLENLLKNAVDAMAGVGHINIKMMSTEVGKLTIDVSDTGKGMSKQVAKQIFKPGFTTKKRGWGLGLALVKRIIEQYHEGKIFVQNSALDKGTTFRIILNLIER